MTLAFVFDSVGAGEWLMLLAVLLVVIGPKRLPGVLRKFGNQYAKFRRAADSFKRQLMEMDTEINRVVEDAEREVESAVGVDDFAEEMMDGETSPAGGESSSADGEVSAATDGEAPSDTDAGTSCSDDSECERRGPYGD